MNIANIFAVAAAIIASLGGGAAIVLGLSNWIGKLFADRYVERVKGEIAKEVEDLRTRLKKSEFLFQKEYEAASAFVALKSVLLPMYRHPDMDWMEACEDIATDSAKIEKQLREFVSIHGAVLNVEMLQTIEAAEGKAGEAKFQIKNGEVSAEGVKLAEQLWADLETVEKLLLKAVRTQSVP